jgi:hypothetical protein
LPPPDAARRSAGHGQPPITSERKHNVTWSLTASGHTPTAPGETDWSDTEQELFDELQDVLSKTKYGASGSSFHGNFVHGEPHVKAEDSAHTHETDADSGGAGLPDGEHVAESDGEPF